MISEGSRDTEDWSNDAENSALHHMNKLHFKIYYIRDQLFEIVITFHNIICRIYQINAELVSINIFENLTEPLNSSLYTNLL